MSAREESSGILKPIIIGVVTTVLSTVILYLLKLDGVSHQYREPPRVEVHQPDTRPERPRHRAYPESTPAFERGERYRPAAQDRLDERARHYDELRAIIDRYNRTARDIIDAMGR